MPKNILIGVCGGISAYKTCEAVREFQKRGCVVRVVMTAAAREFVTPLTFEALTHSKVQTEMFGDEAFGTSHIELARWADTFVIAPATANTMSRLASGQASDLLSTLYLAFRGPVFLAPAMNTMMWEHPAVQENLRILKSRGVQIIDPVPGELACGEIGIGKMAEPMTIVDRVYSAPHGSGVLSGKKVIVTAGPTREYVDPVRFLSSPSTGKMGFSIAAEAASRGANVILVHGPTAAQPPSNCVSVAITSAEEMARAVDAHLPADIFVATAAVADYRPLETSRQKMKKSPNGLRLELTATPDVLARVAQGGKIAKLLIGFAAETENVIPNAKLKMESKKLDIMVANEVNRDEKGFAQDRSTVTILSKKTEPVVLSDRPKDEIARALWDRAEAMLGETYARR